MTGRSIIRSFKQRAYGTFKDAATALIEAAGGGEAAAELVRVRKTQLYAYTDPAEADTHMPVDVAFTLERATRRFAMTEIFAAKHGLVLLAPPPAGDPAGFAVEVARVGEEAAGLFAKAAQALADGRLDEKEAAEWLREIDELLGVTSRLRAHVAQFAPDDARGKVSERPAPENRGSE